MDDMSACIRRINELYHKDKSTGLTPAEKEEQQFLRKRYVDSIRKNIRGQLDQISIQNEDGSIVPLKDKKTSPKKPEQKNDDGNPET